MPGDLLALAPLRFRGAAVPFVGRFDDFAVDALASYTRQDKFVDNGHPECAGYCGRRACATYMKVGEACDSDRHCAKDLSCTDGKCGPKVPPVAGAPCRGLICSEGLMCLFGTCTQPSVKKPGEACTHPAQCIVGGCLQSDGGEGTCGGMCGATQPSKSAAPQKSATPGK